MNLNSMINNRWVNGVLPALLIHVCIGSVYCWSLLKNNIAAEMGVSPTNIEMAFSLAIFFLGMSAAFCGRFVEKNVKYSSLISAICFSGGLLLTIMAMNEKSVVLLYVSYGCIMGIGLGIGYISPVKTLMLWFIKHKGLATGIAICSFGLSKVLLSPFIEWCNSTYSIYTTLWVISISSMFCMMLASLLIKKPRGWVEEKDSFSIKEAFKIIFNVDYIKIWLMFYLNITCGLALIAFEKDICIESGITFIALVSSLTAFFNTVGRFGYSTLSDYMGRKENVYKIIFATSILGTAIFYFGAFGVVASVITLLALVNLGYGGGFSTLPNLLCSKFGMKNISTVHGMALSAWAFAGLSGNQLSNVIINRLEMGYDTLMIVLGGLYAVSLVLVWTISKKENVLEKGVAA